MIEPIFSVLGYPNPWTEPRPHPVLDAGDNRKACYAAENDAVLSLPLNCENINWETQILAVRREINRLRQSEWWMALGLPPVVPNVFAARAGSKHSYALSAQGDCCGDVVLIASSGRICKTLIYHELAHSTLPINVQHHPRWVIAFATIMQMAGHPYSATHLVECMVQRRAL